ncbi:MAG TPA: hypothetical protein VGQ93_14920 [Lysobacter sp.]|jgi:hypothetical protein|nr:hypothetical protein [Lysobacter sp.]
MDTATLTYSQSGRKHSPIARPPDKEAPARAGGSAGADNTLTGTGHANYKYDEAAPQAPSSGSVGGLAFSDIVQRSTPADLLTMVRLHRLYMPSERLPEALQRAIGLAWGRA